MFEERCQELEEKSNKKAEAGETDQKHNVIETAAGTKKADEVDDTREAAAHNLGEDANAGRRKAKMKRSQVKTKKSESSLLKKGEELRREKRQQLKEVSKTIKNYIRNNKDRTEKNRYSH